MQSKSAFQESSLRNLVNPNVPGSSGQPGASGSGTDHDSVGLFQQRASWGTVAQRMDPVWATTVFLNHLLAVPGWRALPPSAAAQAVQRSAYPDAYAQWEDDARSWAAEIERRSDQLCGRPDSAIRGGASLSAHLTLPSGTSPAAAIAITFALAQRGKPYLYGADGPTRTTVPV